MAWGLNWNKITNAVQIDAPIIGPPFQFRLVMVILNHFFPFLLISEKLRAYFSFMFNAPMSVVTFYWILSIVSFSFTILFFTWKTKQNAVIRLLFHLMIATKPCYINIELLLLLQPLSVFTYVLHSEHRTYV